MNESEAKMEERQKLLTNLLSAIKFCQARFGGKSELATESEPIVSELCYNFEAVLRHGLKPSSFGGGGGGGSLIVKKTINGLGNVLPTSLNRPTMWSYVKTCLSKHELERFIKIYSVPFYVNNGHCPI